MANPPASLRARQALGALIALCFGGAAFAAPPAPPVTRPEITRAEIPAPAAGVNHGAAIAELASGALIVCWYSGAHEEDISVRILCSEGSGDGSAWSAPRTAVAPGERATGAAGANKSLGNVTLTVLPDGRLWMIYGVIQRQDWPLVGNVCRNWACGRIDARVSADEGRTWSKATRLVDLPGALPRAGLKPAAGAWLAPFYEERPQRSLIAALDLSGAAPRLIGFTRLYGMKLIQPVLVPEAGGQFRVYFRDQLRRGVWTARLDPKARRWTSLARTNLPNPGAATDAFADDLGRYVLIYNPSSAARDKLALAHSVGGAYFKHGCDLSLFPAEAGAAYPSVIRGRDGAWRVVYSSNNKTRIKFVRFTSVWLEKCFTGQG